MSDETHPHPGHLSRELLDGYFIGQRSLGELGGLAIAHLLEHCPECRRSAQDIDLDEAFRESTQDAATRLRAERDELAERLSELLTLGRTETLVRVASDPRFATLAFARHQVDVASMAYEQGELEVVSEANRLASLVVRRLDPGRYARSAIAWVDAESTYLRARLHAAAGDVGEARRWWRSARRCTEAAGRPPSLRALGHLVGAEVRLAAGQIDQAYVFAAHAAAFVELESVARWSWSIARITARLERLRGEPIAAAARLRMRFEGRVPDGPLEWSVARELVYALLDAGELAEAVAWVASWWGWRCDPARYAAGGLEELDSDTWLEDGWRALGSDAPELVVLLGGLARRRGRLDEARALLEQGREELSSRGRGREAVAATVELLRVLEAQGDTRRQRAVVARLERLADCQDVPRRVLQVLARYGAALWRGRLGDLDAVERSVLVHLGAPIDHHPHGSS